MQVNYKRNSIIGLITVSIFVTIAVLGYLDNSRPAAQEKEPVVRFLAGAAPITAVSFNLGNKTITFDKNFEGSADWFKDLSVNLENSSGKDVTYVEVAITFMPPKGYKNLLPFRSSITKGNKWDALQQKESGMLLKSAEVQGTLDKPYNLTSANPAKEYLENRASLDRIGYPAIIEELQLQIEEVIFSDGTMWSIGRWHRIDPNDPAKLIEIMKKGDDEKVVAFFTDDEEDSQCYDPVVAYQTCRGEPAGCIASMAMTLFTH